MVVAGLHATLDKWADFERDWRAVLDRENVPYFHMKEFNAPDRKKSPYASWSHDQPRRNRFLADLIEVIHRHTLPFTPCGIYLDAYKALAYDYELKTGAGSAFGFCALTVILGLEIEAAKSGDSMLRHAIEKGDLGQGPFETAIQRHRKRHPELRTIEFLQKQHPTSGQRIAQFEAADLVAWEYRRDFEKNEFIYRGKKTIDAEPWVMPRTDDEFAAFDRRAKRYGFPRRSHIALSRDGKKAFTVLAEREIRATCESNPQVFPRRR